MPVNSFENYPMSWRPARAARGTGPLYLALAAVPTSVRHGRLVFTASTASGVLHYEIVAEK